MNNQHNAKSENFARVMLILIAWDEEDAVGPATGAAILARARNGIVTEFLEN